MNQEQIDALIQHYQAMEKAQGVRLFDVFALGPAMIVAANRMKGKPNLAFMLALSGLGTIIFNGMNYVRIEQMKKGNHGD